MKRLLTLGLLALVACGSNDDITTQTQQQALTPVQMDTFAVLKRTGCEKLTLSRKQPIAMYFEAIDTPSIKVDLAKEAIGRLHRQLYCMSAKDYVKHYNRIITQLESEAQRRNYPTTLAPLVQILSETGAKTLDSRTQRLMALFTPALLQELRNNKPIAQGIGLHFRRGLSAVELSDEQIALLLSSTSTYSYRRSTCTFNQAVFFEFKHIEQVKHAFVCLNDRCPIFNDDISAIDTSSAEKYAAFCKEQKGKLDDLKASGTAASGGGGTPSTSPPSYATTRDGLSKCAQQFTSPGQYTCFVESALGGRTINSHTQVIQTKFDLESRHKGCGNPLANKTSAPSKKTTDQNRIAEREKQLEDIKNHAQQFQNLEVEVSRKQAACNADPQNEDKCIDAQIATDKYLELFNKIPSVPDSVNPGSKHGQDSVYDDALKMIPRTVIGYISDLNAALNQYENELQKEKENFEAEHKEPYVPPASNTCTSEGSGCSDTCDIQSQMDLFTNTSNCMGFNAGDAQLDTDNSPQPDPTVMYPSPDAVHASDEFIGLANCVGQVTGAAPIGQALPSGQNCGASVLCNDSTTTIADGAGVCSCKMQASLPDKFAKDGWAIVAACNSTIQCTGETSTCSCDGLLDVFNNPKKEGGLPTDPSVFLMVNYK